MRTGANYNARDKSATVVNRKLCEQVSTNPARCPALNRVGHSPCYGAMSQKPIREPAQKQRRASPYRLELLPVVPAYHRRARRKKELKEGQLVYYGPMPLYYGIGEVKQVVGSYVAVDFRGTGLLGVHEDVLSEEYLIPIPPATLPLL